MNFWIIAVIISTLFWWTASMLMKKASKQYEDNNVALILQYIAMATVALILGWIYAVRQWTSYIPSLSLQGWLMVVIVWIIWYIGIAFLFKAYDHLSGAVALIIANLATFIMYFLNLALFPGQEAFGIGKFIIALVFFGIIVQFLIEKKKRSLKQKKFFNKYALYPLVTAVCWSLFFVWNTYFIKSWMMNPIQVGMLTESMILVVVVIRYLIQNGKNWWARFQWACMGKQRLIFFGIWFFNVISAYLTYYGYQTNQANTVNVIRLFGIPCAAIMCWIFLKDKLSKKQIILLIIAFLAMIGFLFV